MNLNLQNEYGKTILMDVCEFNEKKNQRGINREVFNLLINKDISS